MRPAWLLLLVLLLGLPGGGGLGGGGAPLVLNGGPATQGGEVLPDLRSHRIILSGTERDPTDGHHPTDRPVAVPAAAVATDATNAVTGARSVRTHAPAFLSGAHRARAPPFQAALRPR